MPQYTMMTYYGLAPSLEAGFLGGGASVSKVAIWKAAYPNIIGEYIVFGLSVGAGVGKVALLTGPTSTSDFESKVEGVNQFFGQVDSSEASMAAIVGMNLQTLTWQSGPAKGTICTGTGFVSMLGVSLASTQSLLSFKFSRLMNAAQLKHDANFKGLQLNNGSSVGFNFGSSRPSPLR